VVRGTAAIVTPAYWDEACKHLARRDRVMKKLIPLFGEARLQSRGAEPLAGSPEDLAQHVQREIAKYARIVEQAGVKLD